MKKRFPFRLLAIACFGGLVAVSAAKAPNVGDLSALLAVRSASLDQLKDAVAQGGGLVQRIGEFADDRYFALVTCEGSGVFTCFTFVYLCADSANCVLATIRASENVAPTIQHDRNAGLLQLTEGIKVVLTLPLSYMPRATRSYVPPPNLIEKR